MARIMTISSSVVRGHVGNSATTFSLMRLGHEVSALPTVVLAHHPGHAPAPARLDLPDLLPMGTDVLESPVPHPVDAVLIGYVAAAAQAVAIAGLVAKARALKAGIPVLLDPVCGDDGRLYLDPAVPSEIATHLLPAADLVTPNVTELAALADPGEIAQAPGWPEAELIARARSLGRPGVVVTSAPASAPDRIANLVLNGGTLHRVETPRVAHKVNGTGDLLAGLILAGLVAGGTLVAATARAAAAVHDVLAVTARSGSAELALAAAQDRLLHPLTEPAIIPL